MLAREEDNTLELHDRRFRRRKGLAPVAGHSGHRSNKAVALLEENGSFRNISKPSRRESRHSPIKRSQPQHPIYLEEATGFHHGFSIFSGFMLVRREAPSDLEKMIRLGSIIVLGIAFVVLSAILVAHNAHLFVEPIYENTDYACDSLLIMKAKRLELLHGHYSRFGFYHPGPALLYVLAAAEVVLHDLLGIVPAEHNAHMLGHLWLNAALVALCAAIIARQQGGWVAGLASLAVMIGYFGLHATLASHWFAQAFFAIFLAFAISAASVAAGRIKHLGWLALTGGLAVHAHVSFVGFVVPISVYALACLRAHGGFRWRDLQPEQRRAWWILGLIVSLFLLPMVLHTSLHFPGEIGRYLGYGSSSGPGVRNAFTVAGYLVQTLTDNANFGWEFTLAVFGGAVLAIPPKGDPCRPFAKQVLVICLLSTVCMFIYVRGALDDPKHVYCGVFYGSVLLLELVLIGLRLASIQRRGLAWRVVVVAIALAGVFWTGCWGKFHNAYPGDPRLPEVAEVISADSRWQQGPPLLTHEFECWPDVAGLLVQLERRGRQPCVVERFWDIPFTDRFQDDTRVLGALWQIDVGLKESPMVGTRRILATSERAVFREVETRYQGGSITVVRSVRHMQAKPITGWAPVITDSLRPSDQEAVLLMDVAPLPRLQARLTIRAAAMPGSSPEHPQRVGVAINDEWVGEFALQSSEVQERELLVSRELLERRSPVRIGLTFPDAWTPSVRFYLPRPESFSVNIFSLNLEPVADCDHATIANCK